MKKFKYKGFTLVELLLSIAVLSIVMLVIVAIMRNATVNYKNGNFDVSAQADAQILLSQMEEFLIDANTKVLANPQLDYDEYIIDKDLDSEKVIKWDKQTKQVLYKDKTNTSYSLMADHVEEFYIDGLQSSSKDNACVVSVNLSYSDDSVNREYSSSQKVYFRNNVEDNSSFVLDLSSDSEEEDDEDPENSRIIDRYEVVNLKNEFGIVQVTSINSNYAILKSSNYSSSTDSISKAEYDSSSSTFYIISTAAGTNDNLLQSFTGTVVGKDSDGNVISVNLSTPAWKVDTGANVLELPRNSFNNGETYYMYIPMEGFDIYDYNKYWHGPFPSVYPSVVGRCDIYKDNAYQTGSGDNLLDILSGDSVSDGWFQANGGILHSTQVGKFRLVADPYDNDNVVLGMYGNAGYISDPSIINSHKCEAEITLKFPSSSVPQSSRTYKHKFKFKTMGSSLNDL